MLFMYLQQNYSAVFTSTLEKQNMHRALPKVIYSGHRYIFRRERKEEQYIGTGSEKLGLAIPHKKET